MANSDFLTLFYNLEGDLVSEKKKNFFKLLKAQSSPLTEQDLESLSPRNYLERSFQIDIYIHFKLKSKLLDVIKGGNAVFINKILKHPLLLKEIIGDISAEKFVNDILPCTSYSVRMKMLRRSSFFLDETEMDEITFWVHKRYGFNIALKILHTCSSEKIGEYFSNYEFSFKARQIKFIFDKDLELCLVYLKYRKKLTGALYKHQKLCRYIALKNPQFWLKLKKEQLMGTAALGRKTSKKIIHLSNDDFVKNFKEHLEFLKTDIAVRALTGKFKHIYSEYFPKNKTSIRMHNFCNTLLVYYPKKRRWDLFAQTFNDIFKSDIVDNLSYLNSDFLNLFPSTALKNQWAEAYYNETKLTSFLQYCDPNMVIPLIKEQINVTSDAYKRRSLILCMLQNCSKNKDMASLESVLKYICSRHRNEISTKGILSNLTSWFKLEELNENHWSYIHEMLTFLKEGRDTYFHIYTIKYLEHLIINNKPFKQELLKYIRNVDLSVVNYNIKRNDKSEIGKRIWIELINIYSEGVPKRGEELEEQGMKQLTTHIMKFNRENSKYKIDIANFPHILKYMESLVQKDLNLLDYQEKDTLNEIIEYNLEVPNKPLIPLEDVKILDIISHFNALQHSLVTKLIMHKNRSKFENDFLKYFFDNRLDEYHLRSEIVRWFFVNEPNILIPYIDQLVLDIAACVNLNDIKLLPHLLDFDRKLIEYCMKSISNIDNFLKDESVDEKANKKNAVLFTNVIKILAVLLPTKEYVEIVEAHFLPSGELDVADNQIKLIYYLQRKVANSFKTVDDVTIILPTLMKFCLGSLLHATLPSLYSISHRAPERVVTSYMEILSRKSVSARKHALFLSCKVMNYNFVLDLLRNTKESNVSSQKHVFSSILKFFRRNPTDELLELIFINLKKIDKNDEEALTNLVIWNIPSKYKLTYIQTCWYFFEDLGENGVKVETYLGSLLHNILGSDILLVSLPLQFCRHIIVNYFMNSSRPKLTYIYEFISKFLRLKNIEQTSNFELVFHVFSSSKYEYKYTSIKTFFNTFYNIAEQDIKKDNKIDLDNNYHVKLFKQHWFNVFKREEMFDECSLLDLLFLKSKCDAYNYIEKYAQEVAEYLESLVEEYETYIFKKIKKLIYEKLSFTREQTCLLLYSMLKYKNSALNCMLMLDYLENVCNEHREEIKEILRKSKHPFVSIYLDNV